MQIFGVEWAPPNTPLRRRLQTLSACAWFVTFVFGGPVLWVVMLLTVLCTRLWWLPPLYLAWMLYDRNTCEQGGRRSKWVRGWAMWRFFRDFFPITLVKTADLDPKRNYILCAFPHGVLAAGAFGAFGTDALDVDCVFPGMQPYVVTLQQHFKSPIVRDIVLGLGGVSSSERSLAHVLRLADGGQMPIVVIGGASESLVSRPHKYHIILKRRKGFCRLALQEGADLVPVFSFGENKLYDQVENPRGSALFALQELLRRKIGLAPVLPIGRGLFQYSFGLVPRRAPIAVVVGAPIPVERVADPTEEQISDLHQRFEEALVKLFETHKSTYHADEDLPLIIE